jgi:hypothetical protein
MTVNPDSASTIEANKNPFFISTIFLSSEEVYSNKSEPFKPNKESRKVGIND